MIAIFCGIKLKTKTMEEDVRFILSQIQIERMQLKNELLKLKEYTDSGDEVRMQEQMNFIDQLFTSEKDRKEIDAFFSSEINKISSQTDDLISRINHYQNEAARNKRYGFFFVYFKKVFWEKQVLDSPENKRKSKKWETCTIHIRRNTHL